MTPPRQTLLAAANSTERAFLIQTITSSPNLTPIGLPAPHSSTLIKLHPLPFGGASLSPRTCGTGEDGRELTEGKAGAGSEAVGLSWT